MSDVVERREFIQHNSLSANADASGANQIEPHSRPKSDKIRDLMPAGGFFLVGSRDEAY
jgi:hypothetical protein